MPDLMEAVLFEQSVGLQGILLRLRSGVLFIGGASAVDGRQVQLFIELVQKEIGQGVAGPAEVQRVVVAYVCQ